MFGNHGAGNQLRPFPVSSQVCDDERRTKAGPDGCGLGRYQGLPAMLAEFAPIVGILFALTRWVYPNPSLVAGVVTGLAALVYFVENALKRRVRRLTAAMEYQE